MKFQQSIRWRIQAWHGALLLAVIAACCVTTYRMRAVDAARQADNELDLRLSTLTSLLGRGRPGGQPPPRPEGPPPREGGLGPPEQGPPPGGGEGPPPHDGPPPERPEGPPPRREEGPPADVFQAPELESLFAAGGGAPFYFYAWSRNGSLIARSGGAPGGVPRPERPLSGTALTKASRDRQGYRESFAFTPPGECLLAGRSNAPVEREMRDFAWKLAGIGAGVLVFGLAGGWLLAARAIRPIAEISAAASRIAAGKLSERIHTSETESELGRLATVLDETFQRLDAAFAQQARFTSDAAHELRTPVSVILGQTQLALARERSAEEHRATIEACQRAAKRMHSLIESLLQLSVLDASRHQLHRTQCDLAELGHEHLEMMRPMAQERQITLEADLAPAPCAADSERISQIVSNLLTNAVKFSRSGDTIRIATHRDNGCAILSVLDTGPGIEAKHLPHLFERFYRADASRNRTTGGAGLGLAICKSIAEAHGGELAVESRPGKGSVFTLRIPAGDQ